MTQLVLGIAPPWLPTLDNFVIGRNLMLHTALRHALNSAEGERGFYIWGELGSGKSHLLQALVAQAHILNLSAIYSRGTVPEAAQVVAIDDVEWLDEAAQIALFALYNRMRESGGLLLVSGQCAPTHLPVRDDLRTRLGWGMIYQVQELNEPEKTEALLRHAATLGLILPAEVTTYMLRHGRRDLPTLFRLLDELDELCLRLKRPAASVPLLKELMRG
jgi:DnaA family protein